MPPSHPHRLVSRSPAPWLVLIVAVDRWFVRSLLALPRLWLLLLLLLRVCVCVCVCVCCVCVCVTVTGGRGGARREREASRGLRRHKSTAGTLTGSWRFLRGTGRDLLPIRILGYNSSFSRRRKVHHTNKVEGTGRSLEKATGQGEWWFSVSSLTTLSNPPVCPKSEPILPCATLSTNQSPGRLI